MGSTTMHQAVPYLSENLPVPVINPGPLTYKLAEMCSASASATAAGPTRSPNVPKLEMVEAMLDGAAAEGTA